ncbi:hypothetical protein BDQ17DRAFT_1542852 [Cyathus striatus]|nr:hypothetical protein BDQ17DRAFT_1542852 [Cyathus striatus]
MSFFNRASGFSIHGSNFVSNEITVNGINVMGMKQNLLRFVAKGATHDSNSQYEAPKCHEDTRTQLLSDIHDWIKEPEKETGILLLHGPAGAGKSCIARSTCEKADKTGLIGASFFFWRGANDRNNAQKLFTTIAYQLATKSDEVAKYIAAAIEHDPRLLHDAPLEHQFQKLIYEPCCLIPPERLQISVIVIDGLDECIDPIVQVSILQIIAKAVRYNGFPLGFFITSRPELHLQEVFDTKELIFATKLISLDRVPGVSQDIQTVLESGFTRILNDRKFRMALKSVPRPWPSPEKIKDLVNCSSGQFIYAATVMRFISSPDHNPNAQLEIVLGIKKSGKTSPLEDLDLLYTEILSRAQDTE